MKIETSSQETLTAYHEAGHATAAMYVRIPLKSVSIVPNEASLGRTVCSWHHWGEFHPEADLDAKAIARGKRDIVVKLAGPAAQQLLSTRSPEMPNPNADHDVQEAFRMSRHLAPESLDLPFLEFMWKQTVVLVRWRWPDVKAVAKMLLSERTVGPRRLRKIVVKRTGAIVPWDLV